MAKIFWALLIAVLMAVMAACIYIFSPNHARFSVSDTSGVSPIIASPILESFPSIKVASVTPWVGGKPKAPPGFRVERFAGNLDHPRWLYRLPDGDVLVAETNSPPRRAKTAKGFVMNLLLKQAGADVPSANRISLLRDSDGDGIADKRSILISGLNSPFGMAQVDKTLFVADTDALLAFPFRLGETVISAKGRVVIHLPGGGNHWARNVVASPDGKRLYVSVGSASNIGEKGGRAEIDRANILEVDPERSTYRVFASGLRNPNGMDWEPSTNRLWVAVNERDMLGPDGPPDYLARADRGADYGWPQHYWGSYRDQRVKSESILASRRPQYALGPHTASLGLTFSRQARLGPAYVNGAFIGQHGSWNRVPPSGYKVVFVKFDRSGMPVGKPVDFLTGFLDSEGRAHGRPVGVAIDAKGALLVADDVGNTIWRVSRDEKRSNH